MQTFLGIDWGGTYIKAGIVNKDGQILKKFTYSSDKLKEKQSFIKEIESLVSDSKKFKVSSIGIGAPGIVDTKKGFIYYLPNISGWKNYPLGAILTKKLKVPVFINNDANLFALAEARFGAAKAKSRVVFLTLGTGLGGAVIINGNLLDTQTSALELGHVPIDVKSHKCGCGGTGCIETFTGNKYLLKKYKSLKKNKTDVKNIKTIYHRALKGEKHAVATWKEFSFYLGMYLSGIVNIFNPEVIVFGGGVSGAFKVFKPYLWQALKKQAMWPQLKGLKLVKAKLKDAGIVGAGILAKDSI